MCVEEIVKTKKAKRIFLLVFIIVIIFLGYNLVPHFKNTSSLWLKYETIYVDRFDLTKPLLPKEEYEKIQCRSTAIVLSVSFPCYCIHGLNDIVSKHIWGVGVWEEPYVKTFIDYLQKNPNTLAIDLGAQLGTFSLFAAASGAKVLAVEPFYENIIRIHKSALLSNLQNQIVLITNAISNKRNEIKKMSADVNNIGAQRLKTNGESYNLTFDELRKQEDGKYYVRTALLDDLVPYIPLNKYNKNYKSAIMKIDIEGFEPYAFQNASKLFDAFDIQFIMMEWVVMNLNYQGRKKETDEMLKFLYDRGYTAYHADTNELLNKNAISSWPFDIYWKKN